MNGFPQEKLESIIKEIDRVLEQEDTHPVAAFDADGTLWPTDMGEGLFKYQIEKNLVPKLPKNPWQHYLQMHREKSPQEAFLWLAQINKGQTIDTVRQWAKESLENQGPLETFEAQEKIISHLHSKNVEVYVVTASVKWSVEPAALRYNIPADNVIGVSTKIIDGFVSNEVDGPITYREGKVEGLLKKTNGRQAFFSAGNTTGDLPLLESSSHIRLVMASAKEGHINYEKERHMLQLAHERGWFHHSYV